MERWIRAHVVWETTTTTNVIVSIINVDRNKSLITSIVPTLPLGIITIVLTSIVVIAVLIGMSILCCCICCKCCQDGESDEDDAGEDRPLLGSRYLKRSSTYYQWNRPPPQAEDSKSKGKPLDEPNEGESSNKNWEDRRKALLKKYSREPVTN